MRSLSSKLAFLRLPNILQVFPAAETTSIFLGAGSLRVPRPAPRASRASGGRAAAPQGPCGARVAWPPGAAPKSEADFKLQGCVKHQCRHRDTGTAPWAGTGKRFSGAGLSPTPASSSAGRLLGCGGHRCLWINCDFFSSSWEIPRCKAKGCSGQRGSHGRQVTKNRLFPFYLWCKFLTALLKQECHKGHNAATRQEKVRAKEPTTCLCGRKGKELVVRGIHKLPDKNALRHPLPPQPP